MLEEVPRVRKDAGYPPLVTPSSQIVGTQAVFNVMMGRYKVMTGEFADLMLGYYGATIGPRDPDVVESCPEAREEGSHHVPSGRPAETRVGRIARGGHRARGLQRLRRRCADPCDVPAGGAEVLPDAAMKVLRIWQGSRRRERPRSPLLPARRSADGKGITRRPVKLRREVQRQGPTTVTVTPAEGMILTTDRNGWAQAACRGNNRWQKHVQHPQR